MATTFQIQTRLAELGFDPGPIDGVRGRRTIRAIRAFQKDAGLATDGIAGPTTRAKLFAGATGDGAGAALGASLAPDLPWFEEAKRLVGVREIEGHGNNAIILDWAKDLHIWYPGDDVPWCGLFAAHCVGSTLPEEDLPANPLGARNWRRFGRPCEPTLGAVLVFWRSHPTQSGDGHVGFYAGEDAESFYLLAGNQANRVSIARIEKARLIASRFPQTAPLGERRTVELTLGDAVDRTFSTNEA